jgi:hypothetical protein
VASGSFPAKLTPWDAQLRVEAEQGYTRLRFGSASMGGLESEYGYTQNRFWMVRIWELNLNKVTRKAPFRCARGIGEPEQGYTQNALR